MYAFAWGVLVGFVLLFIAANFYGRRWERQTVEVLQEELRNPEPWSNPLITIRRGDGELIAEMMLWEWVGRAVVNHDLPPAELDYMTIELDGIPVNR